MDRRSLVPCLALFCCGCCAHICPATAADDQSGYTYIPVDPFSVESVPGETCFDKVVSTEHPGIIERNRNSLPYANLLESLPDNAVRMLIEQFDASGKVTYGPGSLASKGGTYKITVDYIDADTKNKKMMIVKSMEKRPLSMTEGTTTGNLPSSASAPPRVVVPLNGNPGPDVVPGTEQYEVIPVPDDFHAPAPPITDYNNPSASGARYAIVNIPIYIGVGLRVSATIDTADVNINISGIGIAGAEAEAHNLKGTLVVQTLGVNGKSVAAALPIQSELNRTTAQNAVVSVGAVKGLLWATDETVLAPRVVGLYLPLPGGKALVNAIISALSSSSVTWERPCAAPKATVVREAPPVVKPPVTKPTNPATTKQSAPTPTVSQSTKKPPPPAVEPVPPAKKPPEPAEKPPAGSAKKPPGSTKKSPPSMEKPPPSTEKATSQ